MPTSPPAARLRRAFHYPDSDDSSTSLPSALDEQEQDHLIETLETQDRQRTAFYRTLFLALPLLSTLPYLPTLLPPHPSLTALLATTSLLTSAYILHALPLNTPLLLLPPLPPPLGPSAKARGKRPLRPQHTPPSALHAALPVLNGVLALVLALRGWTRARRGGGMTTTAAVEGREQVGWDVVPLVVWVLVVLVARWALRPVDLDVLRGRRYGLRGA